jgi:hypothetical protein
LPISGGCDFTANLLAQLERALEVSRAKHVQIDKQGS